MSDHFGRVLRTPYCLGQRRAERWEVRLGVWERLAHTSRVFRAGKLLHFAGGRTIDHLPGCDSSPDTSHIETRPPTLESLRGHRNGGLPCARLMLSVLDDALETVVSGAVRRSRLWVDAVAWIVSDDSNWPFSFLNICDALDLNALTLRRRMEPWLGRATAHLSTRAVPTWAGAR